MLDNKDFSAWLSRLSDSHDIYGPKKTRKGILEWARLEDGQLPDPEPGVPKSSIKTFYFPQPETLFEFSARPKKEDAFRLHEPSRHQNPRLLIGVRPCDARSVVLNSMPYQEDPYFQENRRNTFLLGYACSQGCSTCFCTWTGGSPVGQDGLDILAFLLEDGFVLEPVTERGEELLEKAGSARDLTRAQEQKVDEIRQKAPASLPEEMEPAPRLREKELMALYDAPFWQELSDSCINCGTCTFLCPTCYCFDIQDETLRGRGRRIRYWDSCMFPLFTLHASGHNPRGEKIKRVRNRFMHKLKYFPDRFGPLSCVGCGRCVRDCPVNIDIRQVMKELLAI